MKYVTADATAWCPRGDKARSPQAALVIVPA